MAFLCCHLTLFYFLLVKGFCRRIYKSENVHDYLKWMLWYILKKYFKIQWYYSSNIIYYKEIIQSLLSAGRKRLASQFNFTYSHIDALMTYCPLITQTLRIIPVRCIPLNLRSKTRRRATLLPPYWICSCLSVGTVNFAYSLYYKRDCLNFHITNFPFLKSKSPAYGLYISQLIRYARACFSYESFILRAVRLFNRFLGQGYVK